MIARTPAPPYYAVIFTNLRTPLDEGYGETADLMEEMARAQPGYLGHESVRDQGEPGRPGITVSYWRDLDSIKAWKRHTDHAVAQGRGRRDWYSAYKTRIALVERDYGFGL